MSLKIDVRKVRYAVVRQAFQRLKAVQVENDPSAVLVWWDGYLPVDQFANLYAHQQINKIPAMDILCYKTTFFQALTRMKALYPFFFHFFPTTFQIPNQFSDFEREHLRLCGEAMKRSKVLGHPDASLCTWIVKPRSGCCGNGIHLIQNSSDVANQSEVAIVQRYVSPFLLDERKFDFRFYVLISNLFPLTVYLYNEGLARFCTHPYIAPTRESLDDRFCHLTNTAVNVTNNERTRPILELASVVLHRISDITPRERNLWDCIRQAVLLSIVAIYPGILQNVGMVVNEPKRSNLQPIDEMHRYFHLLGIDIILNDRCDPMVLEINDRPSLSVTYPIEQDLKTRLIFDALKIVFAHDNEGGWQQLLPISEDSAFGCAIQSIVERSSQTALTSPVKQFGYLPSTLYRSGSKRMGTSLPPLHQ
jgi:hypothetical protein